MSRPLPPLLREELLLASCSLGVSFLLLPPSSYSCRASKSQPSHTVVSGDILMANLSSYVDVLLLAAHHAPQFLQLNADGTGRTVGLWKALKNSTQNVGGKGPAAFPPSPSSSSALPPAAVTEGLQQLFTRAVRAGKGPLVVFPECCPSNNRAILRFHSSFMEATAAALVSMVRKGEVRAPTVHYLALQHSYTPGQEYPPVYTAGTLPSPAVHAFLLMGQPSHRLAVHLLPEGFAPQPADYAGAPAAAGTPVAAAAAAPASSTAAPLGTAGGGAAAAAAGSVASAPSTWPEAARVCFRELLKSCPLVSLSAQQFDEFKAFEQQGHFQQQVQHSHQLPGSGSSGAAGKKQS